jgi:hypothetical protein
MQPIGHQHRQRGELSQKLFSCLGPREALQQLLQDDPGDDDRISTVEGGAQGCNLRRPLFAVAPERQRPEAGVDHQGHRRERSAL